MCKYLKNQCDIFTSIFHFTIFSKIHIRKYFILFFSQKESLLFHFKTIIYCEESLTFVQLIFVFHVLSHSLIHLISALLHASLSNDVCVSIQKEYVSRILLYFE